VSREAVPGAYATSGRKLGIRATAPWRSLLDAAQLPLGVPVLTYKDVRYGAVREP